MGIIGSSFSQDFNRRLSVNDSIPTSESEIIYFDPLEKSVIYQQPIINTSAVDTVQIVTETPFKPDPMKSIWLGAVIPGFGQIANKKYWKLPFVYGGFLGFGYAISWNNSRYSSYKHAYRDISDNDETTNYHLEILPKGYNLENFPGGINTYKTRLKSAQDQFRQNRDLSIILSIGFYAIVMLDAYVDAQLFDFDISQDLVLNVAPTRINFNNPIQTNNQYGYGLQCSIRF